MFVESDTPDVVPRGRLMAEEAPTDLGLLHTHDAHRNHFEMHYVVARSPF